MLRRTVLGEEVPDAVLDRVEREVADEERGVGLGVAGGEGAAAGGSVVARGAGRGEVDLDGAAVDLLAGVAERRLSGRASVKFDVAESEERDAG